MLFCIENLLSYVWIYFRVQSGSDSTKFDIYAAMVGIASKAKHVQYYL